MGQRRQKREWGNWVFDKKHYTLEYVGNVFGYSVDLERCNSSAEILDWAQHLLHKGWITHEDIGCLVQALDDLLAGGLVELCGWGKNKTLEFIRNLTGTA